VRLTANEVRCKSLQEFKSPRLRKTERDSPTFLLFLFTLIHQE
jgi:hypothetical protein